MTKELILLAAVAICKRMIDDLAAKLIISVNRSNNTVKRIISDLSENLEDYLGIFVLL